MTAARPAAVQESGSRWSLVYIWAAGLLVYGVAAVLAGGRAMMWINDIAWTAVSACAAVLCFRTARVLRRERRRSWLLLGIGCSCWFIGQLHWDYNQLVLRTDVPFPSLSQFFYTSFAIFTLLAVLQMPEPHQRTPFTFRHVGNLGLMGCCLATTIVLGIIEPALQVRIPAFHLWVGVGHTLLVAAAFLMALYALWTYRWGATWTPMLMLVLGLGVDAVADLVYVHGLLTGSYYPDDLVNGSWLAVFGLIGIGASDQAWLARHACNEPPERMLSRERWLEAVVPALLVIIMVLVAVGSASILTPRVLGWSAVLFVLFAIILGAREAWIQKESQQLTDELVNTNKQLQAANAELRLSELRYRDLATALEQRVGERTTELKRAYEELEGFSYAVAHDLKAPLRAINGFAHLFEAEMGGQLNPRASEHLARIRNGSLRMAMLIDDLLSYSQIDRRGLQPSVVALPALIDSVVAHYADEVQRRRVAVSIDAEPITVRVDVEGLSLALRNLFENALKYTRERREAQIRIGCRRTAGGALLTVADNGIGFDMEYHDHIFKVFQRLHRDDQYPGTGIGLALVRKAIERIDGRVWARSQPGDGAVFHVELPPAVVISEQKRISGSDS